MELSFCLGHFWDSHPLDCKGLIQLQENKREASVNGDGFGYYINDFLMIKIKSYLNMI